ncbi:heme ABC transporter ATP-binding protein [Hydrocoleum sp. CS-953]|uniref:ABC transporter ATP-binding protein n=1 Tax=Hydrocoleum sp. CS-953 TaxID=1671698 RepID=UPI000B9B6AEF|nr:ABC transporter ATP-binding protein [Hydrocoleum sp. CS-953]OZH54516.1 heme ABC transporter ATP-binding protein [Hydrocoleum sp. CS-953]
MTYLRLENITKSFGNFLANDNINISIAAGSIHAILGENGAGKTTLMNILSGLYQPDLGQIYLEDKPIKISSPSKAINYGIGMIHQHFMLVPQLTATENIILGTRGNFHLNLAAKSREINAMAKAYNLEIPANVKITDLPIGTQQRVEIIKVIYRQARILILDEPTAVLTPVEVNYLLNILRQLAANNHTIIFISHKLEEVINVCDTVTVLRRGKVIDTLKIGETNTHKLAEMMVGREVNLIHKKIPAEKGNIVLEVKNIEVKNNQGLSAVNNLSFQLHSGEILGVAGVDGNGQRELADAINNLRSLEKGEINFVDNLTDKLKVGYIPEDRQKMGLILNFSIARNLILKLFKFLPFCRYGFLQSKVINNQGKNAIEKFDIRASHPQLKASQLSGGNQQKIILARELSGEPKLIVAMQPTRGLDIGATEYVQQALLTQKQQGAAILYISTELEEIMAMSDRIAVIYEGQFVDILDAETATVEQVGLLMTSGAKSLISPPVE